VNLRSAYLLVIVISILTSCTKIESTDIGAGLIPPVDNINTFDTSLNTITDNYFDTGAVYPLRTDNLVLGRVSNDPLFGKTTAILNLQLLPEYYKFRFNGGYNDLVLDSVVLVLSYKGVWGDTTKTQTLNVYEIASPDQPKKDSIYSTKKQIPHEPTILGSAVVDVRKLLKDTLKPYNEAVNKDQIRIKITDPSIKNRLFQDTFLLDSAKAFTNRIGGFAIVPDTSASVTSNNLLVVNLADTNTKMAFYYSFKYVGQTRRDTASAYFRFTSHSGFSNQIIRNPAGAEYLQSQTTGADSLVYLQTRPDAPYARIKIPGLDSLKNAIIHRAELLIEQVPYNSLDQAFTPPALFLTAFSTDSSRRFMLPGGDVQFSTSGVANLADFGAYPFKRTINGQTINYYSFNLTQYVQGIVTTKNRNLMLSLSAPFADYIYAVEEFNTVLPITNTGILNTLSIGRIRVGGGSHSQRKMRLRIIYTRI
jgi:hypothetical protein